MKKLLLVCAMALGLSANAQNNASNCIDAYSLCNSLGEPFANSVGATAEFGNDYGCLGTEPNPAWFYLPISQGGNLDFIIEQNTSIDFAGNFIDVDFICYGPFDAPHAGCNGLLTEANIIDCSYSASATEELNIPNAQAGEYYIIMVTNFNGSPGFIRINNAATSQGMLSCSGINLNAFLDANANGVQDEGEMGFPYGNFIYQGNGATDNVEHTVTSFIGNYTIYDESIESTYNFEYVIPEPYGAYYNIAPASYTGIAVSAGNAIETYNFAVTLTGTYQDLAVYIVPNVPPVPGFEFTQTVVYGNAGIIPASGNVTFTVDPGISIISVSDPNATITATGFELPFTGLNGFTYNTVLVTMQTPLIPDIMLGDIVTSTAAITVAENDLVPQNNTSVSAETVVGSYDPNDKTEARGRFVPINEFGVDDYLYYTIRFQNEGTANAINVRITDVLDAQLDPSTVEVLHASHDFIMDKTGSTLTWKFNQIQLPPAETDQPGSHGYVYFKVKPIAGFGIGDVIPNSAAIYFDFNPAIITNTFTTEFVAMLAAPAFASANFVMYPNPAKEVLHITLNNTDAATVVIYDVTGKTLYTSAISNSLDVNTSAFARGTYFVEINGNTGKTVKKLVIQ
ncbi:MAG: T9SS type A sorting domain-containing protein [Bacteroidota bacterium]